MDHCSIVFNEQKEDTKLIDTIHVLIIDNCRLVFFTWIYNSKFMF